MNIEVLQYQAWDITNGNYVIWSRPATRQYIESIADLVALEETLKQIDRVDYEITALGQLAVQQLLT